MAEFTQTAKAAASAPTSTATKPVTPTPEATEGPDEPTATSEIPLEASPTQITCDDSNFDPNTVDVTYPDRTEVTPGQDFVKTWKIKNTGSCTWGTGYTVIFAYGEKMSGVAEPLTGAVAPGEEVEISVRFKAPTEVGEYSSTWRMANASGNPFGEQFYVLIVVR
jgi:hypothetical protein